MSMYAVGMEEVSPRLVEWLPVEWRQGGSSLPRLQTGEYFLVDENGAYLVDESGNYLIGKD